MTSSLREEVVYNTPASSLISQGLLKKLADSPLLTVGKLREDGEAFVAAFEDSIGQSGSETILHGPVIMVWELVSAEGNSLVYESKLSTTWISRRPEGALCLEQLNQVWKSFGRHTMTIQIDDTVVEVKTAKIYGLASEL